MPYRPRLAASSLLSLTVAASAADLADLSPLVNDRTFLVIRYDLSAAKLPDVVRWVQKALIDAKLPPDAVNEMVQPMAAGAMIVQPRLDGLVRSGVTRAAVVVNFDEQGFRGEPLFMLTVAAPDPEVVNNALRPAKFVATEMGDLTVWTPDDRQAAQLVKLTPSARPDLLDAVAKPEGAAVVAAMAIPDAARAELAKTWPGKGPPMDLPGAVSPFDNVTLASLRIDAASPHATLVARTKSAEAVTAWLQAAAAKPVAGQGKTWAATLLAALPVTTSGQTVTIDLPEPAIYKLIEAAVPAMMRARLQAVRVKSASNQRQLLMACMMYANDNKGTTPVDLVSLGKYTGQHGGQTQPFLLTNPRRPELGDKGYVFVPAPEGKVQKIKNPGQRLAIYEAGDFGEGVNVGFWDGHVEFVTDKARFDAELATATAAPAAP